jgi:carotenoid 1,2-hydratase
LSDDGRFGITLIAFIGSVFSPYYAFRRRSGRIDPLDHCALNVALYGGGRQRWTMTERGRSAVHRTGSSLAIGPSALWWNGDTLTIRVDETAMPLPSRVRGVVRLYPAATTNFVQTLDTAGRHHWWPVAPQARVEVAFDAPSLSWSGRGYFDTNFGAEPLADGFIRWDWSRTGSADRTAVLYDAVRRDGSNLSLAVQFDAGGNAVPFPNPPQAQLPTTLWRLPRQTRADAGHTVAVVETLEDAPFYARSVIDTHLMGEPVTAIHESLSLDRFRAPWVRMLLPFRMPRVWSRGAAAERS